MNETNPPYDKKTINEKYICKICNDLFKSVHQAECGCRYCLHCLEQQIKTGICGVCNEPINNEKIPDRAFQKEINNLPFSCVECKWNGKLVDYKIHYKTHKKIQCANCGLIFENENALNEHLDDNTGNCEKKTYKCQYRKIGCNSSLEFDRKTIKEHHNLDVSNHLNLVYQNLDNRVTRLENDIQNTNANVSQPTNLSITESTISTLNVEEPQASSLKAKSREPLDSLNKKAKSSDLSEDMNTKITKIEYNVKCVNDDMAKYIHFTEKLTKDLEESKVTEKKLKEEVDNLTKSLTYAQATIISLEERLLGLEKTSTNGTLVWKITNIREKIQEARSGRQTSIYSSPFYTHPCGFRMCGRVYLNGDGMGRNTHVSLFFVIMRGEYDALLRWPFRQKVTFMLLDQSTNESKENVIDAFRPDPNSNSFKRPTSDMNIASGIPLFCPLAKLHSTEHEYIKDDSMFIKIIVDSRDLIDI